MDPSCHGKDAVRAARRAASAAKNAAAKLKKDFRKVTVNKSRHRDWEAALAADCHQAFSNSDCLDSDALKAVFNKNTKEQKNPSHFFTWKRRFFKKYRLKSKRGMFDSNQPSDRELTKRIRGNWKRFDKQLARCRGVEPLVLSFDESFFPNFINKKNFILPVGEIHVPGGQFHSAKTSRAQEGLGLILASRVPEIPLPSFVIFGKGSLQYYREAAIANLPEGGLLFDGNGRGKHTADLPMFHEFLASIFNWKVRMDKVQLNGPPHSSMNAPVILMYDGASYHNVDRDCYHQMDDKGEYFIHGPSVFKGEEEEPNTGFKSQPRNPLSFPNVSVPQSKGSSKGNVLLNGHRERYRGKRWRNILSSKGIFCVKLYAKTTAFSQPVELLFGCLKTAMGKETSGPEAQTPTMARPTFWTQVTENLKKVAKKVTDFGFSKEEAMKRRASGKGYRCRFEPANKILDRSGEVSSAESTDSDQEDFYPKVKPSAHLKAVIQAGEANPRRREAATRAYDAINKLQR